MARNLLRTLFAALAASAVVILTLGVLTGAFDGPQSALNNDALPFYSKLDMRPRWDRWSSWQHTARFTLVDQRRASFDQGLLERKPSVVGFFFVGCSSVCPISVEVLREFDSMLGKQPLAGRPQILLLSTTPEFDTPDALADYAKRLQLPPDWILATGQPHDIDRLAASLLSDVRTPALGAEPEHTKHLFLLDQERRVRGVYDAGSLVDLRRMASDFARVQIEHLAQVSL
jgi:cytochrome oxidase Cu insertion factor (SCO1/SenC/PrrC family)